ncbi:head-tail joining protein [Jeongeupia chitinilytica]|uniref:Uncharacterized protein n=1 Tax=Jeongeupia chitinilytica TaxID=1041641 RepID=A0ABQ3GZJ8_9NEIS|nr:hypothetical protein [Jeongeupia chitinilytica]GHD60374.1 hypothetical protein GCM10007350_13310 [Jeongeupia chitinilytica]
MGSPADRHLYGSLRSLLRTFGEPAVLDDGTVIRVLFDAPVKLEGLPGGISLVDNLPTARYRLADLPAGTTTLHRRLITLRGQTWLVANVEPGDDGTERAQLGVRS